MVFAQMPSEMRLPRITLRALAMVLAVAFVTLLVSPFLDSSGQGIKKAWLIFLWWVLVVAADRGGGINHALRELTQRKFEISSLFFWLLVVLINATLARGYTWDLHIISMVSMCMAVAVQLYYAAQPDQGYDTFLNTVILLVGLEILRSLPTLWNTPALARMVTGGVATPAEVAAAGSASVGQYGYYTGLAIVLPAIVTRAIVANGAVKIALWCAVCAIALAISISTFMGAVLLMALGVCALALLHLVYGRSRLKALMLYGILLGVFIIVWFAKLSTIEQGLYLAKKVESQYTAVAAKGIIEGDKTKRADMWQASWFTFKENPFFGIGATTNRDNPNLGVRIGAHSSWLDQLGEYGILGFGWYLLFLMLVVRRVAVAFRDEKLLTPQKICYLGQLISCGLFFIGGTYNPVVVITEVFIFLCVFAI